MDSVISLYEALQNSNFTRVQAENNSSKFFSIDSINYDELSNSIIIECTRKGFTKKLTITQDTFHRFRSDSSGAIEVTRKYHPMSKGLYSFLIAK